MIALFIFLTILIAICIITISEVGKKESIKRHKDIYLCFLSWGLVVLTSILCYTLTLAIPPNIHSKKFDIKTKVYREFLDGREILTDTIYVFTLKNN